MAKQIYNFQLFTGMAGSTSSSTSDIIDVKEIDGAALHIITSGTVAGSVAVQASNDGATWVTLTNIGCAASSMNNITPILYGFLRLVYTGNSGSGTLDMYLSCKG